MISFPGMQNCSINAVMQQEKTNISQIDIGFQLKIFRNQIPKQVQETIHNMKKYKPIRLKKNGIIIALTYFGN